MPKRKVGQPTKYKKSYDKMAYVACAEGGLTDIQLAKLFSVSKACLNKWKRAHAKFWEAILKGKDEYDLSVAENCLRKRVTGYNYTEKTKERQLKRDEKNHVILDDAGKPVYEMVVVKTVTKHVVSNPDSIKFFLKNRNSKRWPDKFDIEAGGDITVVIKKFSEKKEKE